MPLTLVSNVLNSASFGRFIIFVILVNAVTLGLETSETIMSRFGGLIVFLDKICLTIFVVEIIAKLAVRRLAFFRSGWSV